MGEGEELEEWKDRQRGGGQSTTETEDGGQEGRGRREAVYGDITTTLRDHATYAKVSRVPSTRSMYSFSSKWSIAWEQTTSATPFNDGANDEHNVPS